VISAIGGLIGIVLGSLVHGFRISVLSANIRFSATWEVLLSGFLLSILVGLIGGWMPARIASRIHAAEAMRRA
jgi:ABC-type antimicrobial peptide transport system permease subunit